MTNRQKCFLLVVLAALLLSVSTSIWEQKRELSRNREKWQAQNVLNYRYHISIISSWGENALMPLTMEYRNGQLVSVLDREGNAQELWWDSLAGIEGIFQEEDTSFARKLREVQEISYDPMYGFPTYVKIYYHEMGVGSEDDRKYTISHFEILSSP